MTYSALRRLGSFIALLILLGIISAFFYKTLFLGQAVSKLPELYQVDRLFNPDLKSHMVPFTVDPCGWMLFYPIGFFVETVWRSGSIPLWNPLNGCGYPLIGDPQNFVFSPFHLLGANLNPLGVDFLIILKVSLAAIGTFLVARALNLSLPAALLASLAYTLCRRNLDYVYMHASETLFPWVTLAFILLAKHPTPKMACLTGLVCALSVYTMHSEPCFFSIIYSTVLCFVAITLGAFTNQSGKTWQRSIQAIKVIALAAIVAILTAAPALLPFIELLINGSIYKKALANAIPYTGTIHEYVAGLLTAYYNEHPFHGCVFIGVTAAILIPMAFRYMNAIWLSVIITTVVVISISLPLPGIREILTHYPISILAACYGLPQLVMFTVLLAGRGLDQTISELTRPGYKLHLLYAAAAAAAISPWCVSGLPSRTATMLCVAALLSLACIVLKSRIKRVPSWIVPVFLIGLNFYSLAMIGRSSLPSSTATTLPRPELVQSLQGVTDRVAAASDHFLTPNLNLLYGINDARSFHPVLPKRYKEFFEKCGASFQNGGFDFVLQQKLPRLIDLASIKYVIAKEGVVSDNELSASAGQMSLPLQSSGRVTYGLRLLDGQLKFDPVGRQVVGELTWRIHGYATGRYALQHAILDSAGKERWSGVRKLLSGGLKNQHILAQTVAVPIPLTINTTDGFAVAIQLHDTWTGNNVELDGKNITASTQYLILCQAKSGQLQSQYGSSETGGRMRLWRETTAGERIYENTQALPAAYIVDNVRVARSGAEALDIIASEDFDGHKEVVLEETADSNFSGGAGTSLFVVPRVNRPNNNSVKLETTSPQDGYLVLTDTYYPGWTARVDGAESPIYRANYLFRAVLIPAGKHTVEFSYEPLSIRIGAGMFAIGLLLCLIVALSTQKPKRSQKAPKQNYQSNAEQVEPEYERVR